VGLIARALEAAGIVTTSVSAARDITAAGRLPRAVFVDFPLGHTTGKVGAPDLTHAIVVAALELTRSDEAEQLVDLPLSWSDTDEWKDTVFRPVIDPLTGAQRPVDDRTPRHQSPQFQDDGDRVAAAATHAHLPCEVCSGVDY
jgi:hypothetical protein